MSDTDEIKMARMLAMLGEGPEEEVQVMGPPRSTPTQHRQGDPNPRKKAKTNKNKLTRAGE